MVKYIGWHGTTKKAKDSILEKDEFVIKNSITSNRVPNDLGEGVYFFTDYTGSNPYELAKKYAQTYKSEIIKRENTSVACIKAEIEVEDMEVLDLDDQSTREYVLELRNKYQYAISQKFKSAKDDGAKKRGNLDGYLIDILVRRQKKK